MSNKIIFVDLKKQFFAWYQYLLILLGLVVQVFIFRAHLLFKKKTKKNLGNKIHEFVFNILIKVYFYYILLKNKQIEILKYDILELNWINI